MKGTGERARRKSRIFRVDPEKGQSKRETRGDCERQEAHKGRRKLAEKTFLSRTVRENIVSIPGARGGGGKKIQGRLRILEGSFTTLLRVGCGGEKGAVGDGKKRMMGGVGVQNSSSGTGYRGPHHRRGT